MSINWAGVGLLAGLYGADQGVKIGRDYINTELSKKLQANAALLNYNYSMKSAKNMPTANRTGLENAGYNPMLAVQNSTSGANSSWTSSGTSSGMAGDSLSNSFASAQDVQRLKNETDIADKTSKKLEAEGENLSADTANKLEENKYIGEKRKEEIANIQADTLEKEARIDNMNKRLELDRYINDSGLATTRRGQDLTYNASTLTPSKYLIDKGESIYSSLGRPKTPRELGEGIANYYYNRRKR